MKQVNPLDKNTPVGRWKLVSPMDGDAAAPLWVAEDGGEVSYVRGYRVRNPRVVERVRKVGRWAESVEHVTVLRALELVEVVGGVAVVSRYEEGQLLSTVLTKARRARRKFPEPVALAVAIDVLDSLHAAGGKLAPGWAHGGARPECIVLARGGRARRLEAGVAALLAEIEPLGRDPKWLRYGSPEQAATSPASAASDVFSVGIMLWEMLSARRAIDGLRFADVKSRLGEARIPRLAKASEGVAAAVARALSRDPGDRFEVAGAFADALRATGAEIAEPFAVSAFLESLETASLTERRRALERALGKPAPTSLPPPRKTSTPRPGIAAGSVAPPPLSTPPLPHLGAPPLGSLASSLGAGSDPPPSPRPRSDAPRSDAPASLGPRAGPASPRPRSDAPASLRPRSDPAALRPRSDPASLRPRSVAPGSLRPLSGPGSLRPRSEAPLGPPRVAAPSSLRSEPPVLGSDAPPKAPSDRIGEASALEARQEAAASDHVGASTSEARPGAAASEQVGAFTSEARLDAPTAADGSGGGGEAAAPARADAPSAGAGEVSAAEAFPDAPEPASSEIEIATESVEMSVVGLDDLDADDWALEAAPGEDGSDAGAPSGEVAAAPRASDEGAAAAAEERRAGDEGGEASSDDAVAPPVSGDEAAKARVEAAPDADREPSAEAAADDDARSEAPAAGAMGAPDDAGRGDDAASANGAVAASAAAAASAAPVTNGAAGSADGADSGPEDTEDVSLEAPRAGAAETGAVAADVPTTAAPARPVDPLTVAGLDADDPMLAPKRSPRRASWFAAGAVSSLLVLGFASSAGWLVIALPSAPAAPIAAPAPPPEPAPVAEPAPVTVDAPASDVEAAPEPAPEPTAEPTSSAATKPAKRRPRGAPPRKAPPAAPKAADSPYDEVYVLPPPK